MLCHSFLCDTIVYARPLSDTMLYYEVEVMTMEVRVTVTCNKGNSIYAQACIAFDANILEV